MILSNACYQLATKCLLPVDSSLLPPALFTAQQLQCCTTGRVRPPATLRDVHGAYQSASLAWSNH